MRLTITPLLILIALTLLGSSFSCSLFETRDPEDPGGNSGIIFRQPDRAEVVMENLQNAIRGMSQQNYLQSLNQELYEYNASQPAQAENPDVWSTWSYENEQIFFNNLSAEASNFEGHQLQLFDGVYEIISNEEQQFTASYTITVNHNRTSQNVPTVATGEIILRLQSDENGLWYITTRNDIANGDVFSWSDLKAIFVRG